MLAAKDAISHRLAFLATQVRGPYLFGDHMTVADTYLFVMLLWAEKQGVVMPASLKQLMDNVMARPTVQVAMKQEGLIS